MVTVILLKWHVLLNHMQLDQFNMSSKDLELACKAVSIGLSIRRAAEEYQIPQSTIQDHVSGKVASSANSGQQKYLTDEEEEELVEFLLGSAKIGYPQT